MSVQKYKLTNTHQKKKRKNGVTKRFWSQDYNFTLVYYIRNEKYSPMFHSHSTTVNKRIKAVKYYTQKQP